MIRKISIFYRILSFGENLDYTHAEHAAILNLPNLKVKKNLKNIDIVIIRVNKSGSLINSKPCIHCILNMYNIPLLKGYVIKNIYYSNETGIIIKEKLINMLYSKTFHLSKYYSNMKI